MLPGATGSRIGDPRGGGRPRRIAVEGGETGESVPSKGPAAAGAVSRLIHGTAGGVRRGPRRTALDNGLARAIDRSLGVLGAAKPLCLVSGFWRSGTTWMQECLGVALQAKTVFEPLSPMEPLRRMALRGRLGDASEDVLQAIVPGPCPDDEAFWGYLKQACTGRLATTYLMSCRRDIAESFCRGTVVKDVRLQANLAEFHRRFRTPVVHVRRHPCAVVASLVAADWHWSFARVTLATLLPHIGGAVAPDERATIVARFDTDLVARIAAFWAVTERLAAEAIAGQPWGAIVFYEAFAATPESVLEAVCLSLGVKRVQPVDFAQPSASVSPEAFAAYGAPPPERWRAQLPASEIARICAIADAVFPGWNRVEPATGMVGDTQRSGRGVNGAI